MQNTQAPEKSTNRLNGDLEVVKIWKTIQGEGPFAGMPAVFMRLAGCNLQCPLCDTDYTSIRHMMTIDQIAERICGTAGIHISLVVLTGGEPFRQNIQPVIGRLNRAGLHVQIESNGTLSRDHILRRIGVTVVCSPKTGSVHPNIAKYAKAWKYVVQHGQTDPDDGLPLGPLGMKNADGSPLKVAKYPPHIKPEEIYIQPADEQDPVKNKLNTQEALAVCFKFGYRVCLQTHKILGVE